MSIPGFVKTKSPRPSKSGEPRALTEVFGHGLEESLYESVCSLIFR